MKEHSIRALSILLCAFILIPFLAACKGGSTGTDENSSKITAINMFYQKDRLELAVGERSSKMHITVTSSGDFSREQIEFVSDDENVAAVNYESTSYTSFIYFTVVGVSVGETDIYFKSKNSEAVSDKIHVTVHESQKSDTVTTAVETTPVTDAPSNSDASVSTDSQDAASSPQTETNSESVYISTPDSKTVYVTPSGEKYHYSMSCAGKNAIEISLGEARLTHEPCKKCVGDSEPSAQDAAEPVYTENHDYNNAENYDGITVYITPTGKKYHLLASCAGKNATATTKEIAEKTHEPCKKCAQ